MSQFLIVATFVVLFVYGPQVLFFCLWIAFTRIQLTANVQRELILRCESAELQMLPEMNVSARGA